MVTPAVILPFMAASTVANAGLAESSLKFIYLCSGAATLFTTTLFGFLSDRLDKLRLLACIAPCTVATVLVLTRLGPSPAPLVLLMTTLFYVSFSAMNPPVMTMVINAVDPRRRGAFMGLNAALQQATAGLATLVAGLLVTRDAAGRLVGYPNVGYLAALAALVSLLLAWRLRNAAADEVRRRPSPGDLLPDPARQV